MLNSRRKGDRVNVAAASGLTFAAARGASIARRCLVPAFASILLATSFSLPATLLAEPQHPSERLADKTPRQWAAETAANEIVMLQPSNVYLRYRMHVVDQKGDQLRDIIESTDGTVARLLQRSGRPLTADEDAAERQRLEEMLTSPDIHARHTKNDASAKKMAVDLIRQMPDAMIYTYTPGQPQVGGIKGGDEIVLDFSPNPAWPPPSTMAEALTGLQGRVWIDRRSQRMVRMEGHIFKPVNFGWGMLAHIYPGGSVSLEQTNAGSNRWIYTHFVQDVNVRALMLKTLKIDAKIDASDFQVLPAPLTYQEAVRLLLATPLAEH